MSQLSTSEETSGGGGGANCSSSGHESTLSGCSMIRRDPYLLQHRAALVASPETVAAFLAEAQALSLDLSKLRVGWSAASGIGSASAIDCGTATRFLFLGMKRLLEENCKPSDPGEAQKAMVSRAVECSQRALQFREMNSVDAYYAAAVRVWNDLEGTGSAEMLAGAKGIVPHFTDKHYEECRLILSDIYRPCGTSSDGIPMILLRPSVIGPLAEIFLPAEKHRQLEAEERQINESSGSIDGSRDGSDNTERDANALSLGMHNLLTAFSDAKIEGAATTGEGAGGAAKPQQKYEDADFTPCLIGITEAVFKGLCDVQSRKQGYAVDRMTVLVDCSGLDFWMLLETKRLAAGFFEILKVVCPETLEMVYMVNVPPLVSGPVSLIMRLFTDEDSHRRVHFLASPAELGPFIGEENIPPALYQQPPQ